MSVLLPYVETDAKVSSEDIVNEFIESGNHKMIVDYESMNRKKESVYATLRAYTASDGRVELKVKAAMENGKIVLINEKVTA